MIINSYLINPYLTVLDILILADLVKSKELGRRLVEQGAVKINDEKITDWDKPLPHGGILSIGAIEVEITFLDVLKENK
jgi:hypothetical protein